MSELALPHLSARPEDVWRAVRAKARPLLIERLRTVLWLMLASFVIFLALDITSASDRLVPLALIKVVQFSVAGAALWALRVRPTRSVVVFALLTLSVVALSAAASAVLRHNATGTMGLYVVFTIGAAMTLPWGMKPQAVAVTIFTLTLAWSLYELGGTLAALVNPATGTVLTAGLVSIYVARDAERYRYQIEEREQGLRLREEHFRALIEHGSDIILVADASGLVQYVSPSVRRLLGYEPSAWIGTALDDYIHAEDKRLLREAMSRGEAAVGPARSVEIRLRDTSGAWHVLDGAVANLLDNPAVRGIVLNARDITRRKQTETELRRSEASLSALIESTSDSVWSIDRERRLVVMNSAVRKALATYGVEARPGQGFEDRAPSDLRRTWSELYGRVLAGESLTTEQCFELDHVRRYYLISMCPIREGGEVTGATVFSRDITDLRETEALARRNQMELTHALRLATIGEISSALAHEINQPLGAISNYASGCVNRLESASEPMPEITHGLQLIAREALRAGEIIRGIRDLGRKGDGEMDHHDPNDLVRRAVVLAEPEADLQRVDLHTHLSDHLPQIYGDGIQIEQVILNLILNGIEAMHSCPAKTLSIFTAYVDEKVEVAIRDTGSGFDAALGESIFEPFFTTKPTGLGMGLAISRRIVEAHGGRLRARLNEDGGSTFSFTLPAVPRQD